MHVAVLHGALSKKIELRGDGDKISTDSTVEILLMAELKTRYLLVSVYTGPIVYESLTTGRHIVYMKASLFNAKARSSRAQRLRRL